MQTLITENLTEGFVLYPDSKSSFGLPTSENENAGRLKGKAPQTEGRGSYEQVPNHEILRTQYQIPNQGSTVQFIIQELYKL